MKWREIRLDKPEPVVQFQDGARLKAVGRERQTPAGPFTADLVLYDGAKTLELADAVDDGETTGYPRLLSLQGDRLDAVFLLGGPVAHRVTSSCSAEETIELWRRWENSEHWTTHLVDTEYGALIVCEAGVLLIGRDLTVRWHQKKYFTDSLDGVERERVRFRDDHDAVWHVSLRDGTRLANGAP
jgi:hypothetical protein